MSLILVADDEEAILDVTVDVLDALGHEVVRATDGEQALSLARSRPPDLVVSDVMMPRRTGVDLVLAMRADPALADIPVILMSAARSPRIDAPIVFLPKPLELDAFEAAILTALQNRSRPSSPSSPSAGSAGLRASEPDHREEMLNWVAHELKTPLGSVKLNTQLVQRRMGQTDPTLARPLEAALRGVVRMESLINSILDAGSLVEGRVALQTERRDLRTFLADRVEEWRTATADRQIDLELPAEAVCAMIDSTRLSQVIDNLLSNAAKYGGGSPVTVQLERTPNRAAVHVRDRGPGIPASELPHLFERFHRVTGTQGTGHGLGLFIAAAVARLHGGALAARSTLGEGATFTLTLPLAQ